MGSVILHVLHENRPTVDLLCRFHGLLHSVSSVDSTDSRNMHVSDADVYNNKFGNVLLLPCI